MQVDILASGSKGNSTLIRTGETAILIDCGSSKRHLTKALADAGIKPEELDALLITHSHTDHIAQLKMFSHLPVYSWCSLNQVPDHHPIFPDDGFDIKDFHIEPLALSHDAGNTLGFIIYYKEEKLVYVTDTGYIKNSYIPLMQGADIYVFESNHDIDMLAHCGRPYFLVQRIAGDAGHLCNEDAALALSRMITPKTRQIVLAHISQDANTPELALDVLYAVLSAKEIDLSNIEIHAALQFEPLHIEI